MRQAGRSLPEYRARRGSGDILDAVRNPDLAAELTLQPVLRHGVDAAILFSDIMVPLAAVVDGVSIQAGHGPVVDPPFRSQSDLKRLRALEPENDIPYVAETVRILREELGDVPLIGFAGAPFTVASYLVEGGASRDYTRTKVLMRSEPELWAELTRLLAGLSLAFLRSQVEAGAQAVQLFDSWVGSLSDEDYRRFALPASRQVLGGLSDLDVPRIHFGVGTAHLLDAMAEAGAEVVGCDWRVSLAQARARLGSGVALQGNLDPTACLLPPDRVKVEVERILDDAGGMEGHIFNLGHGILPDTDPDTLTRIVEWVHESGEQRQR